MLSRRVPALIRIGTTRTSKNLFFLRGGQRPPGEPGLSPARSRAFMNLTLNISIAGLV